MKGSLKLESAGIDAVQVRLDGNPSKPEPIYVRTVFPGGEIEVVRAKSGSDSDYWVHLRVNHPDNDDVVMRDVQESRITDARIDRKGHHTKLGEAGIIGDTDVYHVAVRVTRVPVATVAPTQQALDLGEAPS